MIDWSRILYGGALTALAAAAVLATLDGPRCLASSSPALAAAAGPISWNAILRAAHNDQFFTDAPVAIMPASWQDTGSGVFAVAACALALAVGPFAADPARRVAVCAAACGLIAFLVDVYLY
jgi:hypothetical protein